MMRQITFALIPMAIAWQFQKLMRSPVPAERFTLPARRGLEPRLIGGAAIFGIGILSQSLNQLEVIVERGKILLAEFGYGGKLLPSFPSWLIEGTKPQRLSWLLKSEALPWIYWNGMLKGREWMAQPAQREAA